MPPKEKSKPAAAGGGGKQKDEGKYSELPGAVEGKVVVRFSPEASGYLHLGHAKTALLNAHYQRLYEGKLVFRFDDTIPGREREAFENIIEGDVELLGIKPDQQSYTSDWFELMLEKAVEMIKNDKAYVDDTPPEKMTSKRGQKIASHNRVNTVERNLSMWQEMVVGSAKGQKYCLRAKIDMNSDNGCLRDPTIYRCKPQEHPKTGYKYKVYPTYDFACPIVDSVEGITHALRTSEYKDHDEQYNWFCDTMNIRKPAISSACSRLNLMNTVLSTQKLSNFVQKGTVDGWDDPRMPTVRGVLRRGLTVEGLQQFIASQGSSKSAVAMEWDKIWALNRKVIDPIAHQYTAVEVAKAVPVILEDTIAAGASINVALHPKLPEAGTRAVPLGNRLLIDQTDAQLIAPNTVVTFIDWGNVVITGVEKNFYGLVTSITGKLNIENKDFKKTRKVRWLESTSSTIPALLLYFDHLIKKPVLGKDDDFKKLINQDSHFTVEAHVDLALKELKKGSIIQIQRKGFFIVDEPYSAETAIYSTGKPRPIHLISIPDGSKDLSIFPRVVQEGLKANAWVEPDSPVVDLNARIRMSGDFVRIFKSSAMVAKKQTRLGMQTSKAANYSEWYTEVITKGEMIEYYGVSGCYILRPWSFAIWEAIIAFFDAKIKSIGVKNSYFPIFSSDLYTPIAIRPTSETVMYPTYAKWVQSYRDLPIQLNQWCNVVRWELRQPTPFLLTREFLWQEGHSAFATEEETMKEVFAILDFYAAVYEELLAIPVIKGRKTEKEKFAGVDMTTTIETYVDVNGRAIQGATSNYLGQNFSKKFNISFKGKPDRPGTPGERQYAYQASWGMSTRTIGAMIMIHGDEKGLVLPPRVADLQVVIVPCGITAKTGDSEKAKLVSACEELEEKLKKAGVRVKVDDGELTPGQKSNHWELKGVPIRVELGPKDLAKEEFVTVRRDTGVKKSWPLADATEKVKTLLEEIQASLLTRATKVRDDRLTVTESWTTLLEKLEQKFIIMAPFCGEPMCEEAIKKDSAMEGVADAGGGPLMGAKSLCIPFQQPKQLEVDTKCIHPQCTREPRAYTLFGRSY